MHSFPSNENAIDHILAIQRNIQEYESIIKSPVFTEKQIYEFEVWPNKFKDFIKIIFQSKIGKKQKKEEQLRQERIRQEEEQKRLEEERKKRWHEKYDPILQKPNPWVKRD